MIEGKVKRGGVMTPSNEPRPNWDVEALDHAKGVGVALLLLAAGMVIMLCAGCAHGRVVITTTERPGGETVTVTAPAPAVDPDLAIVIADLSLRIEQIAFDQWLRYDAQQAGLDAAALAAETARRTERINQLTAELQALYEARAKQ